MEGALREQTAFVNALKSRPTMSSRRLLTALIPPCSTSVTARAVFDPLERRLVAASPDSASDAVVLALHLEVEAHTHVGAAVRDQVS